MNTLFSHNGAVSGGFYFSEIPEFLSTALSVIAEIKRFSSIILQNSNFFAIFFKEKSLSARFFTIVYSL